MRTRRTIARVLYRRPDAVGTVEAGIIGRSSGLRFVAALEAAASH